MTTRRLPFVQLDVFTSRPLEGNPLAVFPDGRGLSDSAMQALAREMNLSETTFIIPRPPEVEQREGVKVRIFTVAEELPFAGHPTLGTALHLRGNGSASQIVLDLHVGKIPITFAEEGGGVFGEMRQVDPQFGSIHSREEVAGVAGLAIEQIDGNLPIQTVSTGMPFAIVPLVSLEAARTLHLDWGRAAAYAERSDAKFFYFLTRETVTPGAQFHARMIFYNGEDPATGSAAGCAAAWAVRHGVVASGKRAVIEQGLEVSRPSFIHIRATRNGAQVTDVGVGGHAVEVLRGEVVL